MVTPRSPRLRGGRWADACRPRWFFLDLGALASALAPRAEHGRRHGLVAVAFVPASAAIASMTAAPVASWEMFGALLEAPGWLLSNGSPGRADVVKGRGRGGQAAEPLDRFANAL